MKFMKHTAGCSLFEHRRNEDILEELILHPVEKKFAQYKYNDYITSAGRETSDTQNDSLIIDLSEDEDLDDR